MPSYTYVCKKCDTATEAVFSVHQARPKTLRCKCGGRCTRHFTAPQVRVFTPYVTEHITGKPIEIRSAGQEDAICERHGKARLLDSETIDLKGAKAKRKKLAMAKMTDIREDYARVSNEIEYGKRPTAEAPA